MKILKISFSRSRKKLPIISWLLQWYQNENYSHVLIEIDHKRLFGVDTIFHSSGDSGVSYYSKPIFLEKNTITDTYIWAVPDELYKTIRTKTHAHLGHKYAFAQNIGVLLVDLARKLGIKIKNPWKKGYNCSEIVFEALCEQFPEYKRIYDPNSIKPVDIEKIVKHKKFMKTI